MNDQSASIDQIKRNIRTPNTRMYAESGEIPNNTHCMLGQSKLRGGGVRGPLGVTTEPKDASSAGRRGDPENFGG